MEFTTLFRLRMPVGYQNAPSTEVIELFSNWRQVVSLSTLPNGWILIFSIANDTNRPQVMGFTSPVQQL